MQRFYCVLLVIAAVLAVADAFSGSFALSSSTTLGRLAKTCSKGGLSSLQMAHHPEHKAAKKAARNRPKKHSLSDINRKPPSYDVEPMAKARQQIPEYTVIGKADMGQFVKIEKDGGNVFYHVKAPHA